MFERRDILKLALGGLAGVSSARAAVAATPAAADVAADAAFDPVGVIDMARALSRQPYVAPATALPDGFGSLTYDQYVTIRSRPGTALWQGDGLGFAVEPLHRGFIFTAPVQLFVVENGQAHRIGYDASRFDFGKNTAPTEGADLGFSGFRVLQIREGQGAAEMAIFQGASFFRAVARGQTYGVMARALCLRTADPKGEEFPFLRSAWIERPSVATNALVIHAIIDSESVAGAFRFTLRPGDMTIVDTECTLFPRVQIDNFGLGGMSAMSFTSPLDRRRLDDVRSAVYSTTGVQMLNGNGEWLWRPVANRETLQVSAFVDQNPRGFGMLQRNRAFDQFQDDDQHWENRPSLWIEPIGEWGEGGVQLVEIPSESEINDNIIAFWRPKAPIPAKGETSFAYRQFWCWSPAERPALATVTATRGGRGASAKRRRFLVEFTGDVFANPARPADLRPMLTTAPGTLLSIRTFLSVERRTFRVLFEVDFGNDAASELRLVLTAGGKPASETWLYRWTA